MDHLRTTGRTLSPPDPLIPLAQRALDAAARFGHDMGRLTARAHTASGACRRCGALLIVARSGEGATLEGDAYTHPCRVR